MDGSFAGAAGREELRRAMARFVPPVGWKGVLAVASDFALYALLLGGVLFLRPVALKLACSVLAGVKISNLATLSHDGAHGNLTRSPRWNKWLAVAGFLPGLYNYRLWIFDHHYVHHPYVNGKHRDSWVPYTKAQFDALPRWRQRAERLYRAPWGVGFAPYYIIERWWQVKLFPRHFVPARFRVSAWRHFALVAAWLAGLLTLLALAPLYSPTGSGMALLLGFAVPFYVWQTLFSFTVYVQHTEPRIPWFDGPVDRRTVMPQEALALHLVFPRWFRWFGHNVFEHPAHHVNPRIPFHRLEEAQALLNRVAADRAVVQRFSFAWLNDTLRRCRLYDYDTCTWLDFDGRAMAAPALTEAERELVRTTPGTMLPDAV